MAAPADILREAAHRVWPLPAWPWVATQTWSRLLFAHWPVAPDQLRPLVPAVLELDTFDGQAWLGVVPFEVSAFTLRGRLPLPGATAFPEINVRTYIQGRGRPGVYFFSLDTPNWLAVAGARLACLPYYHARIAVLPEGELIKYASERTPATPAPRAFTGAYEPASDVFLAQPGSLERWLTERYCLYTRDPLGDVLRGEIHHYPWPLQLARAVVTRNTMLPLAVAEPCNPPSLLYAREITSLFWPFVPDRVGRSGSRDGL
ncbi:MAG: DUF2071 domain-containing protein [Nevskia sp.]|nr:DUF2071 domain-containing protein [Nevskia sp.]